MFSEKESIQYLFEENFKYCKKRRIILYGELKGIRCILSSFPDFTFSGVIIKDSTQKKCLGRKALNIVDIKKDICDLLIMVDMPSELRSDFISVGPICVREKIPLYDLRGIPFLEREHYLSKDEQLIFKFQVNFGARKENRIALCGKIEAIKVLLNSLKDYAIIGLLDNEYECLLSLGIPVLKYKQILEYDIDTIICVTDELADTYKSYFHFCYQNKISFYNLSGDDLLKHLSNTNFSNAQDPYFDVSEQQVKDGIIWNDIICFSVFDCLFTKKVLDEEDLEKVLQGIPYCKNKWENIKDLILPRKKVLELFNYAVQNNKVIFIVLESEIPVSYIKGILESHEIVAYKEILVCKNRTKEEREKIFKYIRNNHQCDSCLYIGTDSYSCAELTEDYRINFFTIKSTEEMLEISAYREIRSYMHTINERSLVGLVLSYLFNNPFILYKSDGRPPIYNLDIYVRTFIAPLVTALILWLGTKAKNEPYDKILFSSRDGYLICTLYNKLRYREEYKNNPEGIYFLISRRVASCAGIRNKEDLDWLLHLDYIDTFQNVLIDKFGFEREELTNIDNKNIWSWISQNRNRIFEKAQILKINYMKYIRSMGMKDEYKYGFYDMVSSGTSQYFLSKILNADIRGLYLCWYDTGNLKRRKLSIESMFTNNRISPQDTYSDYVEGGYIYEDYDLLEMLLSSPESSLKEFDDAGRPLYLPEKRTASQIHSMENAQKAMESFFEEYMVLLSSDDRNISKKLVEELFRYKNKEFTNESCNYFDNLINFDDLGLHEKNIYRK